ncbi:MAG: 5-deoxy-glucuronate isomerase, partial [Clostridia bacterium]|nr:5-deoxy-glucuronate isomerase [Clostridia bacterium]
MNFKKTYVPKKGYTPVCKIGECSLSRLEFGIVELDAGEEQPFDTGDKETGFIVLYGHCDVLFDGGLYENVGNRNSVFENRRAECFYMPRDQKLTIQARDALKIAVCATPIAEKTEPQLLRADRVPLKLLGRPPFERETSFL